MEYTDSVSGKTSVKSGVEVRMYLLLHELQVSQTFSNVEIMLRIYQSVMISNCTGERILQTWYNKGCAAVNHAVGTSCIVTDEHRT